LDEYLERIAAAGKNVDEAAAVALRAGGEVARDGMVRRVAKDTHNLEAHIEISEVVQDGNYSYIKVGVLHADAETARYGNAQEYGTSSMAAQSYIRATMDEDGAKIKRAMKESFEGEG
jgi:HK97 gp10 family phage protein